MYHTNNKAGLPRRSEAEAGQMIIEAVIALASILLTLTAITIAIVTSVSNSQFIKQQTQASKYAQDGMERLRYERNTNAATFFSRNGIWCMGGSGNFTHTGTCDPAINPDDIIDGQFKRQVEFTQPPNVECGDITKAIVNVYWSSGKCGLVNTFCHKSQLVSCFTDQSGAAGPL